MILKNYSPKEKKAEIEKTRRQYFIQNVANFDKKCLIRELDFLLFRRLRNTLSTKIAFNRRGYTNMKTKHTHINHQVNEFKNWFL